MTKPKPKRALPRAAEKRKALAARISPLGNSVSEAHNLLAAIVESSDDAIISKNLDGVILSWNRGAERMFGYSAREAIGKSIVLIIPTERRDEENQILKKIRRGERVNHFETVRVRKDGTAIDISVTISPVKNARGRILGASKVARDITERKIIELERQRFVALADRCTEFIGMYDMSFRPFYVNKAGLSLVGIETMEQACATSVVEFFFPEDRPFIFDEFLPRVLREGAGEVEVRFRHFKTGAAIWMIYNVFVIKDLDGKSIGLGTFSQNITVRKHYQQALEEQENQFRTLA